MTLNSRFHIRSLFVNSPVQHIQYEISHLCVSWPKTPLFTTFRQMTCDDISQARPADIHPSHHKHPSVLIQVLTRYSLPVVSRHLLRRLLITAPCMLTLDTQYGDALRAVWTAVPAAHQLFGAASCFSSFQAFLPSSDRPVCPGQNN